jgi:hypothetical protein
MINASLQTGVYRTQLGPRKGQHHLHTDESGAISTILAISRTACMDPRRSHYCLHHWHIQASTS